MDINDTIYNIHVFGDSHSQLYGSPYLSNYICNVYDVGEITMDKVGKYNLTTDKLKELVKKNDIINNGDLVIYVFGEIDVRNYNNKSQKIKSVIDNYINTILSNNQTDNIRYGVQSITPPVDVKNINKDLSIYENIEDRINSTRYINTLLKESCEKNNLLFIDISTYYQNDNSIYPLKKMCKKSKMYELDSRIKDDNVHVHINNPEGIEYAFNSLDIPINFKYYKCDDKCKYTTSLNKFQRDYYKRIRISHYIYVIILIISLFVPDFLIP